MAALWFAREKMSRLLTFAGIVATTPPVRKLVEATEDLLSLKRSVILGKSGGLAGFSDVASITASLEFLGSCI